MLPSVVEDSASPVNDFQACLVDATCFRLALFSSCSYNYARCQCGEREGAPQHCAMLINKVVKGHLWRHSYSPEGDSASVSRMDWSADVQLDIAKRFLSAITLKWEASASWCASTLWCYWNTLANTSSCQTHLKSHLLVFFMFSLIRCNCFLNCLQKRLVSNPNRRTILFS